MTFKKHDHKIIKFYKSRTIKLGRRSIYDIIKDESLDMQDKIDYIRHHYTYYEGNYELFHDKKGRNNKYKDKLNNLIKSIILKEINPSILKRVNKIILKVHKKLKKQKELQQKELLASFNKKQKSKYKIDPIVVEQWAENKLGKRWKSNYKQEINIERIKDYLQSEDNLYSEKNFLEMSYKQMRGIVADWENKRNRMKFRNLINQTKYDIQEIEKYIKILKEKALQK